MDLDSRDIVFATYRAGGGTQLVDGFTIAAELGAQVRDIDAALADAVDRDLLIRDRIPQLGRLGFRLAPIGQAMVDGAE